MKIVCNRWIWLLGLLFAQVAVLFAQDDAVSRCERIYQQLTAGQGDSIYVGFSKELQTKISPAVFNDAFKQVEAQFGKLQAKGEWKQEAVQGITIYYSDLKFERYQLRLLMAFDPDGQTNTIRFVPVPAAAPVAAPADRSNAGVDEREITVGAEGFKLPGTLTLPKSSATENRKFPLVILVHGSGPQDRDETIGPNKPFRDLAWGLAERGVAVIRYEKRTIRTLEH